MTTYSLKVCAEVKMFPCRQMTLGTRRSPWLSSVPAQDCKSLHKFSVGKPQAMSVGLVIKVKQQNIPKPQIGHPEASDLRVDQSACEYAKPTNLEPGAPARKNELVQLISHLGPRHGHRELVRFLIDVGADDAQLRFVSAICAVCRIELIRFRCWSGAVGFRQRRDL